MDKKKLNYEPFSVSSTVLFDNKRGKNVAIENQENNKYLTNKIEFVFFNW